MQINPFIPRNHVKRRYRQSLIKAQLPLAYSESHYKILYRRKDMPRQRVQERPWSLVRGVHTDRRTLNIFGALHVCLAISYAFFRLMSCVFKEWCFQKIGLSFSDEEWICEVNFQCLLFPIFLCYVFNVIKKLIILFFLMCDIGSTLVMTLWPAYK